MKLSDIILMCFRNLTRSKGRTFLTVIGVIVGTCAITVMISIGIGMQASMEAMLAQMGDLTIIEIRNYSGVNEAGEPLVLDDKVLEDIKALDRVMVATPIYEMDWQISNSFRVVAGRGNRYQFHPNTIIGIDPEALELLGYELSEGSYDLTPSTKRNTIVMITGEYTNYSFYDTKRRGSGSWRGYWQTDSQGNPVPPFADMMADDTKLQLLSSDGTVSSVTYDIQVSGRLVYDGARDWQTYEGIYMDIDQVRDLEAIYRKVYRIQNNANEQDTGYSYAKVKVTDMRYVEQVEAYIKGLGYDTYSMETVRKPLEEQARQQQVILGCLGGISLFVAAIGIANTMFMSILERTREIGIMKVVGCFVRDIRIAFLMEASSIGFLGGCVGVVLSFFISYLMNKFGFSLGGVGDGYYYYGEVAATDVSIIPWWLVIAALIFSTVIGLVSGYFPANRAVKIEALEAIKHE